MRYHVANKNWNKAFKVANTLVNKENNTTNSKCASEIIYSEYVLAQWHRKNQRREDFFDYQQQLVNNLNSRSCSPTDFYMTENEFENITLDATLWLARLFWENNKNSEAKILATQALSQSQKNRPMALEAIQILVGRIGFESENFEEIIALLNNFKVRFPESQSLDLIDFRKGLFYYKSEKYAEAAEIFANLKLTNKNNLPKYSFWQWKSLQQTNSEQNPDHLKQILTDIGESDPLGFYDTAAANLLKLPSLHISSDKISPFESGVNEAALSLILNTERPFKIFADDLAASSNDTLVFPQNYLDLAKQTIILYTYLYAEENNDNNFTINLTQKKYDRYITLAKKIQEFSKSLAETNDKYQAPTPYTMSLAWINAQKKRYKESIMTASKLTEKKKPEPPLGLAYLMLYPRPYLDEYKNASKTCNNIDINLLYAISRQESLFDANIVSGAGAVGLMQLLPSTAKKVLSRFENFSIDAPIKLTDPKTNLLAGACYLSDLITRYKGNLALAIGAYNAGETAMDNWAERRNPSKDLELFIEFIPFDETQKYVQRVLRNYSNMRWIYGES